tara:strand:- start:664 stop:1110 length:447 start_codon:yes stop_codon:yes gene_type:complete
MIFIKGSVPSSKNSKIHSKNGVFNSPAVSKYLRKLGIQSFSSSKQTVKEYKTRPNEFRDAVGTYFDDNFDFTKGEPCEIGFYFVRESMRLFDVHNIVQLPCDLLSAHNFIPDDNVKYIIPVFMKIDNLYWHKDKDNPGMYIKILNPNK